MLEQRDWHDWVHQEIVAWPRLVLSRGCRSIILVVMHMLWYGLTMIE